MNIYHIKRDYRLSLAVQKKLIREQYRNVVFISSDGKGTLTVFAEGRNAE